MNNLNKSYNSLRASLNLSTDTGSFYSNAYTEAQVLESNVHGKPRTVTKSQKSDRYSSRDQATTQPVNCSSDVEEWHIILEQGGLCEHKESL